MPKKAAGKEPVVVIPKKRGPAKKQAYNRPVAIPLGAVLTDNQKKQWKVGPSIGSGGFGEIYCVCPADKLVKKTEEYPFVLKIEPSENGPLFVEMHFYMRNAKLENINEFKKSTGLKFLGMPHFICSGSHELNDVKHRFIVMPRYGKDIWNLFLKNGRKLPLSTIYRISIEMLNVLEYIHKSGYVHADIKGSNILLGFGKGNESQINLVDFGLAARFNTESVYKPDPKKKHNGTIEYTSRDAHDGVITMRGDLEILGYNIIHWSGAPLPWEAQKLLDNPQKVQELKEASFKNVTNFLIKCFSNEIPDTISTYMNYIAKMSFNEVPDYNKCRKMFEKGLKDMKKSNTGPLELTVDDIKEKITIKSPAPKARQTAKSKRIISDDSSPDSTPISPVKRARSKKIDLEYVLNNTNDSMNQSPGSIVLNNNVRANGKPKKKYELNFELDLSLDADVVVTVNRKPRNKTKTESEQNGHGTSKTSIEHTPKSSDEEKIEVKKPKTTRLNRTPPAKTDSEVKVTKAVTRAGEYKGKKAK